MKDSEKLQTVLNALDITANKMSIELEFASPSAVYHILNDRNSLSKDFKDKIIRAFPNVNYSFLTKGELPVILDKEGTQNQMNLFNLVTIEEKEYQIFKGFIVIPEKIKSLENEVSKLNEKMDEILKKLN